MPSRALKTADSRCLAGLLCLVLAQAPARGNEAEDAVLRVVERHAASPGATVQVELASGMSERLVDCESPKADLPGRHPNRWGAVTVRVTCNGNRSRPRYVQARVAAQGDYWVLRRDIKAGAALDPSLLERRHGDLSRLPRNAITALGELEGKQAARALARGTLLQSHWVKAPTLVERRQPVTLRVKGSGFQVSREVEALDEGGLGDRVRVRLPERKVVTGTVTGTSTVTLD